VTDARKPELASVWSYSILDKQVSAIHADLDAETVKGHHAVSRDLT
jgi:hypothetical protein